MFFRAARSAAYRFIVVFECIIIFSNLCTDCVFGVLEVWGAFNGRSEQPDSPSIPLSGKGAAGYCIFDVYLLLWVHGKWLFFISNLKKCVAVIICPPLQQLQRHPAANMSPYMSPRG